MRPADARASNHLATLLAALDSVQVRWALLRGEAGLGVTSRDVDLLVSAQDLPSLEDVVFARGGVALPATMHPWHRFYVLGDQHSDDSIKLDIVTELIYNRDRRLRSGLEAGCLDRRVRHGDIAVLEKTDMFWTVLLHCILDKQGVNQRRSAELRATVHHITGSGPVQDWFESLCPPGWSAERAVDAVLRQDWESLLGLGRQILGLPEHPATSSPSSERTGPEPGFPVLATLLEASAAAPRKAMGSLGRRLYPTLWRRAGLGATPRVLDVVEAAGVNTLVASVRRRPGWCDVVLLAADADRGRLLAAVRGQRYRPLAGGWNRITDVGLERVRVAPLWQRGLAESELEVVWASASPVYGRRHSRRVANGLT